MSLELITPVNDNVRRDVELADPTLLDPNESDCLVQGEWLTYDSSAKAIRATSVTTTQVFQVWSQKGDLAGQAIGKICVLMAHEYEADTDMFKDNDNYAVGSELTVDDNTIDGVTGRASLELAASGGFVHAICTKIPSTNGGKLRFIKRAPYIKA